MIDYKKRANYLMNKPIASHTIKQWLHTLRNSCSHLINIINAYHVCFHVGYFWQFHALRCCAVLVFGFFSIYDQHDEHETHQTNSLKKVYHCWVFDLVILVPSLSLSRIYMAFVDTVFPHIHC